MSQNVVLSCPNCATRFSAPIEQFIPNGRQVRCSQCQHMWFHGTPSRTLAQPSGKVVRAAPERTDIDRTAVIAPPETADTTTGKTRVRQVQERETTKSAKRKGGGGLWSWLLWLIVLALLLAILAYVFREPLRKAVPQAAPWLDRYTGTVDNTAQGLIGRTEKRDPFRFRNIHYDVNEYDGDKEILVEADLVNTSSRDMPAPKVRVRVVDGDRAPLHASVIDPEDMSEMIPAGTSTRYFVRIPEPPADFEAVLLDIQEE